MSKVDKYILAVDDEPVNRDIIEETLSELYELECVTNGEEALASIATRIPDLLLLDVAMPGMNGIEVCQRLRNDEKTKDLTIFMLSGFANDEAITKGMEAGANRYITKPFLPSELEAIIEEYFSIKV